MVLSSSNNIRVQAVKMVVIELLDVALLVNFRWVPGLSSFSKVLRILEIIPDYLVRLLGGK